MRGILLGVYGNSLNTLGREDLLMNLKRGIISVVTAGMLAVSGIITVAPAAQATSNPSALDRGDFTIQCRRQYHQDGWAAQLTGSGAYGWKCVYLARYDDQRNIDINSYCMSLVGNWAAAPNPSDPYSWHCQGY